MIQENVKTNITAPDYISEATIYIRKVNRTFEGMNSTCTFSRTINDSLIVRLPHITSGMHDFTWGFGFNQLQNKQKTHN